MRPDRAFLVGDAETDIEAGRAAGCTTLLVDARGEGTAGGTRAGYVVASLGEAVDRIVTLLDG